MNKSYRNYQVAKAYENEALKMDRRDWTVIAVSGIIFFALLLSGLVIAQF